MEDVNYAGLATDENITELIQLLKNNGMQKMSDNLIDTISYIEVLQGKIDEMTTELGNMRHQLDDIQFKQDRSVGDALKDAYKEMYEKAKTEVKASFAEVHGKAVELKQEVRAVVIFVKLKSAEIVNDVKEKGKRALSKVVEILKVKPMLEKIQWKLHVGILDTDKTIQRIEYYMENIKESKAMKKNAKRVLHGKAPNATADKKMPLMEFAKKAFYWQKGIYESAELFTEASIGKINDMTLEVRKMKTKDEDKTADIEADKSENMVESIGGEAVSSQLATSVAEPKTYGADAFEAFEKDMQEGKADSKLVQMVMEEFEGRGGKLSDVPKTGNR